MSSLFQNAWQGGDLAPQPPPPSLPDSPRGTTRVIKSSAILRSGMWWCLCWEMTEILQKAKRVLCQCSWVCLCRLVPGPSATLLGLPRDLQFSHYFPLGKAPAAGEGHCPQLAWLCPGSWKCDWDLMASMKQQERNLGKWCGRSGLWGTARLGGLTAMQVWRQEQRAEGTR